MKVEFKARRLDLLRMHLDVIREAFKQAVAPDRVTVEYPRERKKYPANFRGIIVFDKDKCISCFRCAHICPANAIQMTFYEKAWPGIDYTKCIFCHFCVDSCPTGALRSTKIHDIAFATMGEMKLNAVQMLKAPELTREDSFTVEYVVDSQGWRLEKKAEIDELALEQFIIPEKRRVSVCVDPESCLGCRLCVELCPNDAISVDRKANKLNILPEKCTGCGICVRNCPMKVLELKEVK
ncbi:MAG: 4Fe-4S binding protein [Archaeoglobales archaeon]|jgi:NADH-quinone oxidoreductase subunit I|nr:4Fe-4S binding protein [Archaeoglobi archaeon]NHW23684.1 4Fe-4S binding protein [Archaeoglobales archaeon]TDA30023.1 MAG: 4Fe-4S ferredoxin [Archaeoglobi archaeon]